MSKLPRAGEPVAIALKAVEGKKIENRRI